MWDEITYPFLNFNGLGMDKQFHPILYNGCDYISMLGLKLNHVSKRGYLVVRCMCTSLVSVCIRQYGVRPYCFNHSKFANYITHPLIQTFQLPQPPSTSHSHSHPLILMYFHWQLIISFHFLHQISLPLPYYADCIRLNSDSKWVEVTYTASKVWNLSTVFSRKVWY